MSHGTNIQLSTRLERRQTMNTPMITAVKAFLCMLTLVAAIAAIWPRTGFGQDPSPNGATQLNYDDPPCDAVARGRAAFHDRNLIQLGGNGRACSDCHLPSAGFQLSPAAAQARFDALLAARAHNPNADDPLFRPVDADDFRVNGERANDFSNLIENGLIRVSMPLPMNVRLIDPMTGQPTDETSVDLWRAVMPVLHDLGPGPDAAHGAAGGHRGDGHHPTSRRRQDRPVFSQ
jgi:hypothetical protein